MSASHIDLLLGKASFSARSSGSLMSFEAYKDAERSELKSHSHGSSFSSSAFPEFETLSLRIEPPTVTVSQREDGRATVVELGSANRPNTLCEVSYPYSANSINKLYSGPSGRDQ